MTEPLIIWWVRRDLRLADMPALQTALDEGGTVLPVFIRDEQIDTLGAAPKWRFGLGLEVFSEALEAVGSTLILRSGDALTVLQDLIRETGARGVFWTRAYDPASIERDTKIKSALKEDGLKAESFAGHLLFEPWTVKTQQGGYYKVYSPFWKTARQNTVAPTITAPKDIPKPSHLPSSESLADWKMGAAMRRGADVVARYVCVGDAAAQKRLADFIENAVDQYKKCRDFPSVEATSRLSENLTYGEISPRRLWYAGQDALRSGAQGAEHFLKEVAWREFAYHLLYHTPEILEDNWRGEWDAFSWRGDNDDAQKWRQGLTGQPMVDAAMRELYVTGTMHNRCRMLAGSFLTKHLLTDWRVGRDWFEECLIDWDIAANAMGWQWIAGCGPDAAPYFRVFNPETQGEKFDSDAAYRDLYLRGGEDTAGRTPAQDFYKAIPQSWNLSSDDPPPDQIVSLSAGRKRALDAYSELKSETE